MLILNDFLNNISILILSILGLSLSILIIIISTAFIILACKLIYEFSLTKFYKIDKDYNLIRNATNEDHLSKSIKENNLKTKNLKRFNHNFIS